MTANEGQSLNTWALERPLVFRDPVTGIETLLVGQAPDQDPIFDHANGTKNSVTASAPVLTPPAGCKFARISADADIVVNTAGNIAVDDGSSVRIVANQPEVIPVVAGVVVNALSLSGTAVVRCTPMKVRP